MNQGLLGLPGLGLLLPPPLLQGSGSGTLANRPAAGRPGRAYYATDTGLLYRDNGASWDALSPFNDAEGDPADPAAAAADGTSTFAARRDHAHKGTLVKIAESILGADIGSVSFTSIPGTYRHLRLVLYARTDRAVTNQGIYLQFNGDSGANYDWQAVRASGATASGDSALGDTALLIGRVPGSSATASEVGLADILIPQYAGGTFFKGCISYGGEIGSTSSTGNNFAHPAIGTWRSTAAITRVDVLPAANNLLAGSVFTLYGLN